MTKEKTRPNNQAQITVLNQELTYDFGFDTDSTKFLAGDMFKVTATTRAWLILTNFHGTAELNITNN